VNQNTLLNSGEYGYKKFESVEKSEKKGDDLNDNLNTP